MMLAWPAPAQAQDDQPAITVKKVIALWSKGTLLEVPGVPGDPDGMRFYVTLTNPNDYPVEVSGMKVTWLTAPRPSESLVPEVAKVIPPRGEVVVTFRVKRGVQDRWHANTRYRVEAFQTSRADLSEDERAWLRIRTERKAKLAVLKVEPETELGIPLGFTLTLHNRNREEVREVRVLILGYDNRGRLTQAQVIRVPAVPGGKLLTLRDRVGGQDEGLTLETFDVVDPNSCPVRYEGMVIEVEAEELKD
jgi:hypothetical protein